MFRLVGVGAVAGASGLWLYTSDAGNTVFGGRGDFIKVPGADVSESRVLHGTYDVVVVGGGIVGMATANEVLRRYPNKKVAVLEKEGAVGLHQSSHNSGVIHAAGVYYKPGTMKADCCMEGYEMMYDYAEKKKIPFKRVGKLIVATNADEDKKLKELYENGLKVGAKDLRLLTGAQVKAIEPNVQCTSAITSPNSGIIDFAEVTRELSKDVVSSGGKITYNFAAETFTPVQDGLVEITGKELDQYGPTKYVQAKNVITCAGLHMDTVGYSAGGDYLPKVVPIKGTYYQLKPEYRNLVKRNIYPMPSGLNPVGIHFTPTVSHDRGEQLIIGPGFLPALSKEGYTISGVSLSHIFDLMTNTGFRRAVFGHFAQSCYELLVDVNKGAFLKAAQAYVPGITADMIEPSFSGVMANAYLPSGESAPDYIFDRKALNGTTLNLRNAPSPAATSSLSLARKLVDMAEDDFEWKAKVNVA